jgi:2-dehydropantoate 2-reductase
MRILIYGAGVIGQVYGGRFAQAGHAVTLLARGPAAEALAEHGVVLRSSSAVSRHRLEVVTAVPAGATFDVTLVCVRRDQLTPILPSLAPIGGLVVFLVNWCTGLAEIRDQVGTGRTLFAFPGVAGRREDNGTIEYTLIKQQHTTIERRPGFADVAGLLRGAGFTVDGSDDMDGWLKTHAVFITAVGAAILGCGGDSVALAADRGRVGEMVLAVREGFRALASDQVTVTPTPLRIIFTAVPRFFAVRYWQAALRGPVGTLSIAPHIVATRSTEFASLAADVRGLVHGQAPYLDKLLSGYDAVR